MSGPPGKLDPFKPSQPAIPGVPEHPPEEKKPKKKEEPKDTAPVERPAWQSPKGMAGAGLSAVVLLAIVVLAWRATKPAALPAPVEIAPPASSASAAAPAVTVAPQLPDAPGPVVTVEEIAKPWAVARFQFHRSSGEIVNGMVIRLPGAPGYWGLLSVAPYGRCQLELDTDLKDIREKYKYAAAHPMVVDPCTQAVYDPLALGSTSGAWVRGKVAAGPGIRPPFEVEIKVEQGWVIASRSE